MTTSNDNIRPTKGALSPDELERYNRQIILPEFNIEGQEKLKEAKVLVIGCGGLGSPVLVYLTSAGVGTIGIIDFDMVDRSNLHRQILFNDAEVGEKKVDVAKRKLNALNPNVTINTYGEKITSENALDIIEGYDIVADGSDNFPTRYLVNDACILANKPLIYGSIHRFEGQVSVFNLLQDEVRGPNYRDLFPVPPPPDSIPDCAEGGVLGVLPGMIGTMQANEVIKVITGIGNPLSGKLFLFDALKFESQTIRFNKNENSYEVTKLIDYEAYCGVNEQHETNNDVVKEIDVATLAEHLKRNDDIQIIDVRNPDEYTQSNIGGELIPLKEIAVRFDEISKKKKVVVHCKSGKRSEQAIRLLQNKHEYNNLYNLKGGIIAFTSRAKEDITSI
ncbi:MAG: molybdopterin-synthase adenylyltransferase MoeB [Bacteroidetes bacterium]|nr:molybdopterin-synthase adenylyltransferase MoeB [Bacteroidota bacterium]